MLKKNIFILASVLCAGIIFQAISSALTSYDTIPLGGFIAFVVSALFLAGLLSVSCSKNMTRIILGFFSLLFSVLLLFGYIAYAQHQSPIAPHDKISAHTAASGALVFAAVLITVLEAAFAILHFSSRLYTAYKTPDISKIRRLRA